MKSKICTLLIVLFFCGKNFAQDTTKVEKIDLSKFQSIVDEIQKENTQLQRRLQELENSATNDNLKKVIKASNIETFKSDINILEKRHEAGEKILYHIIKETNHFHSTYQNLILQTQFASLTNPMSYPTFTNTLQSTTQSLKSKQKPIPDIAADLSNLKTAVPYLSNPIVNSGLSIVSCFIARYNKKNAIKNEQFEKLTCVLNFISITDVHYKVNVAEINRLATKVQNFNLKLKDFFDKYLKTINYNAGYAAYVNSITVDGSNIVAQTRSNFFNSLLSDSVRIGVVNNFSSKQDDNVAYYVEQVKFLLSEYEALLLDIENSISNYGKFYQIIKETSDASCDAVKNQNAENLHTVATQLENVKTAFNTIYVENKVPVELKIVLFGL